MTQSTALSILKTGENVFLTGAPGAGKTYLLNQYIEYLHAHEVNVAVTAYTGIAASHINGRTLHSWAGLTRGPAPDEKQERERVRHNKYLSDTIQLAQVLIIDEVSMLHPAEFDRVDLICRIARNSAEPFGGLQLICCGDFFQIPPVNGEYEKFVIDSSAWKTAGMRVCYLHEQHRQGDAQLLGILAAIRSGMVDRAGNVGRNVIALLESRIGKSSGATIGIARLYTHRENVDEINANELRKLPEQEMIYEVYQNGPAALVEKLKKDHEVDRFVLKVGARVMFTKNNMGAGYVNGTLGEVIGFQDGGDGNNGESENKDAPQSAIEPNPIVMTFDKHKIIVGRNQHRIEDEKGKVRASVSQLPLKLAWAITVHKSQGMTLDAAEIDLGRAFDRGMGYVALSRVRRLENISLIGFNAMALQVSPRVRSLDAGFMVDSTRTEEYLKSFNADEQKALESEFLARVAESKGAGAGGATHGGHNTAGTAFDDLRIDYSDIDELPIADF
jgi:ATP-dependent exoDNAse (exonuclease V) alpha subunit